jgi:hypothetical protein
MEDPAGFFVSILVDSANTVYRLFCTESDYTQGITATGTPTIEMVYNSSHRLATSTNGQDQNWAFVPLFNKTIQWTVDLSTIPCGLNATFYSCNLKQGQSYADACATNPSATEFDFMEANQSAWHTTLHLQNNDCGSAPPIGIGGTISDSKYLFKNADGTTTNTYGLGIQYTINTQFPFTAAITQTVDSNGVLQKVQLTLAQSQSQLNGIGNGGQITAQWDETNEEYPGWLAAFGNEINTTSTTNGNVLFWSLWTGGLDWLESPPCPCGASAPTSDQDNYVISDMQIFSA